jgi:hypothetical protein
MYTFGEFMIRRRAAIITALAMLIVCAGWVSSYWFTVAAVYDHVEAKVNLLAASHLAVVSCEGGVAIEARAGIRYEPTAIAMSEVASHDFYYPRNWRLTRWRNGDYARTARYFGRPFNPHPLGLQLLWQSQPAATQKSHYRSFYVGLPYWFLLICVPSLRIGTLIRRIRRWIRGAPSDRDGRAFDLSALEGPHGDTIRRQSP